MINEIVKSLFKNGDGDNTFDTIITAKNDLIIYSHKFLLINFYSYFESMYELMDKSIIIKFNLDQFSKQSIIIILNVTYGNEFTKINLENSSLELLLELLKLHDFLCPKTQIFDQIIKNICDHVIANNDYIKILKIIDNIDCKYYNNLLNIIVSKNKIELNSELLKLLKYKNCDNDLLLNMLSDNMINSIIDLIFDNNNNNNNKNNNDIGEKIYIYNLEKNKNTYKCHFYTDMTFIDDYNEYKKNVYIHKFYFGASTDIINLLIDR
jgi:hypothetical protein